LREIQAIRHLASRRPRVQPTPRNSRPWS
jgi:hypothetical protein